MTNHQKRLYKVNSMCSFLQDQGSSRMSAWDSMGCFPISRFHMLENPALGEIRGGTFPPDKLAPKGKGLPVEASAV